MESTNQFESRKRDHVIHGLRQENQAEELAGWHKVQLLHEALPEINFQDITLNSQILGKPWPVPVFISSMTAGHPQSLEINLRLAKVASSLGLILGVGSQRRELTDASATREWTEIRKIYPNLKIFGNIGLAQLITTPVQKIVDLMDQMGAAGLFIHTNPLQEALQMEGTPQFKGGLQAVKNICSVLKIPIVLKEVGCGFAPETLKKLNGTGLAAVDLAGAGGTHWGRMELARRHDRQNQDSFGQCFSHWGISTVDSLILAQGLDLDYEIWASGGVRSAIHIGKALALGAKAVGIAKPCLEWALGDISAGTMALEGATVTEELPRQLANLLQELRTVLFCTGSLSPQELGPSKIRFL